MISASVADLFSHLPSQERPDLEGEARLRNARYTIRIPTENFELFMKSSGNVAQ